MPKGPPTPRELLPRRIFTRFPTIVLWPPSKWLLPLTSKKKHENNHENREILNLKPKNSLRKFFFLPNILIKNKKFKIVKLGRHPDHHARARSAHQQDQDRRQQGNGPHYRLFEINFYVFFSRLFAQNHQNRSNFNHFFKIYLNIRSISCTR